ncbi:MAG: hypothetical protein HQK54_12175, partial [Oligoflexales bacterium]|nr:hypothetical protein [Oligoflexales bacterium]
LFSGSFYLVVKYGAIRSMYGPSFVTLSVLASTLYLYYAAAEKRWHRFLPLVLVLMSFLIHQYLILSIKNQNHATLEKKIWLLKEKMAECNEPCVINISNLEEGLVRDWVLHEDYYRDFASWQKNLYFPNKEISFRVEKTKAK